MRIFIYVSAGIAMTLFSGDVLADSTVSFAGLDRHIDAGVSSQPLRRQTLDSAAGRLEVTPKDQTYGVELRDDQGGPLAQPAEGQSRCCANMLA